MLASQIERLGETLARSPLLSLAAIVVVALACFLPGFTTLAPLDGDEPGYAVAAREMVATRDYASVRLQTENAEWRPRGAYWIEAFLVRIAGGDAPMWVYRLPSLISGVATAALTWWLAIAFGSPPAALLAGLFVATSGILGLEARLATPDAILLAATTLCGGALARVWLRREGKIDDVVAILFWVGLGVAILAKGVVAPAIVVAAVVVLSIERGSFAWLKGLRPAVGVVWLFLIISPWLVAIALALGQGAGEGPSADFLVQIGVPFQIEAPPGSYALVLPLLAGPVATFLFLALRWIAVDLRRPVTFFALAWGGPLWLAAELITTKLPQAILPAIPAVAILAAFAIDAGQARIRGPITAFYSIGPLLWPPLIAIGLPLAFVSIEGHFPAFAFAMFLVAAVLGPLTWLLLRRDRVFAAALLSMVTVVFIYIGFFGSFVPAFAGLRIGERIAAAADEAAGCPRPAFAASGYPEESLVLALGPDTRLVNAWSAADFLNSAGCRVAAVDASQISAFRQRAEDLGLDLLDRGRVGGFNLRKMRIVDIHLFTAAGASR